MHEQHPVERRLKDEARRLSAELEGGPVVIVVGGVGGSVRRTLTASSYGPGEVRLRDLLGLLEASIQIESLKHFGLFGPERGSGSSDS
jgi:hypothetical protein